MIQALFHEPEKETKQIGMDEIPAFLENKKALLWLDIQKPTAEDMSFLEKTFNFHVLSLEDCLSVIQRPKIDRYENYIFVVLHAASLSSHKDRATSLELDTFIGENYVVTVRMKPINSVLSTWERCAKNSGTMTRGAGYLFYTIADALTDNYFPILEELDKSIEKTEQAIFKDSSKDSLSKIFSLKESVLTLRRFIGPQRETINFLARSDYKPIIGKNLSIYFRDIYDLMSRISDSLDTYRDALNSAFDAHLSTTSNRLNEIMKVLTIIATIMMPLTLISGIYGMNFKYMPEISWKYGYLAIILVMALVSVSMLIFFKRKKWL